MSPKPIWIRVQLGKKMATRNFFHIEQSNILAISQILWGKK